MRDAVGEGELNPLGPHRQRSAAVPPSVGSAKALIFRLTDATEVTGRTTGPRFCRNQRNKK